MYRKKTELVYLLFASIIFIIVLCVIWIPITIAYFTMLIIGYLKEKVTKRHYKYVPKATN